jgi:hypothetical protein
MCIIYTFLYPVPLCSECITGKYWGYFPNSGNPKSPIRCVAPPSHPPKIPKFQHPTPFHFAPLLPFPSSPFPPSPLPHPLHFPPSIPPPPSHPKPTIIPFYTPLTPIYPHHPPPTPTKNATLFSRHFARFCVRLLVYDIIMILF